MGGAATPATTPVELGEGQRVNERLARVRNSGRGSGRPGTHARTNLGAIPQYRAQELVT